MRYSVCSTIFISAILTLGMSDRLFAQEYTVGKGEIVFNKADFSPFVDQHYPDRVLPDAAYRFAKGEEVTSSGRLRVKLIRPLDFLVVADHSEYMGLAPMLQSGDQALLDDPYGKTLYEKFNAGGEEAYGAFREIVQSVTEGKLLIENPDVMRTVWTENNKTADAHNEPGRFTAFIGYEWSSLPDNNNLHRVVVFRDDASYANQVIPFTSIDSADAERFWEFLANYEAKTGGKVLAIAH
jgi:hypothetical protein